MDKGVGGADQVLVGVGVEGVAGDDFASAGQVAFRSRAHQAADMVSALQEYGDQAAAEVARSSSNEDAARVGALRKLFDLQQKADVRN